MADLESGKVKKFKNVKSLMEDLNDEDDDPITTNYFRYAACLLKSIIFIIIFYLRRLMNNIRLGCRIISLLIFLTLIAGWRTIFLVFQQSNVNSWSIFMIAIGSLFFILNIVAASSLYLMKRWAFIFTYIAILFSTILFGACYLPFITKLFPVQIRSILLIMINLGILSYVIYLNILFEKNRHSR